MGYGLTGDAHHITTPVDGRPRARCHAAARNAGITPGAVDYLNAHGVDPVGDVNEVKAIKEGVFGEHAKEIVVNSTKSIDGPPLGRRRRHRTVFTVMAVANQVSPPTINVFEQDPECDVDVCANAAREMTIRYAMKNSFGFGGTNSTVIYKRFEK